MEIWTYDEQCSAIAAAGPKLTIVPLRGPRIERVHTCHRFRAASGSQPA